VGGGSQGGGGRYLGCRGENQGGKMLVLLYRMVLTGRESDVKSLRGWRILVVPMVVVGEECYGGNLGRVYVFVGYFGCIVMNWR
jgi:hypothetical protein